MKTLDVGQGRIHRIRNGLANHFLGLPPPRSSRGIDLRIAVIGPFTWIKGAPTVASALTQLLSRNPRMKASWLGASLDAVHSHLAAEVSERVTVIPRFENDDLPHLLAGHQILVMLSRVEGFPGAILEAMACGLAVIASDIPAAREIGSPGGAVFVPPGDGDAVVREIETLNRDRGTLDALRLNGHKRSQTFSWDDVAAETEALYRRVIRQKRSS